MAKKGYHLIARNFQTRFGEIDLVFGHGDKLIFVEVKLKVGEDFGTPEEMINKHKLRQVEMTAQSFLMKYPSYEDLYKQKQIDAVCIVTDDENNVLRIDHYENITG